MERSLEIKQLVKRKKIKIVGDTSRVITLPLVPSKIPRINNIIKRVLNFTQEEAEEQLEETFLLFANPLPHWFLGGNLQKKIVIDLL